MSLPEIIQLNEFNSSPLFLLESRSASTYRQLCELRGNSVLSSIFVESIDPGATIKINYFDTTTSPELGQRFDLVGHDLIDDTIAPLTTLRIVVPRIHHRVVCEAVVTGGSAKFSVYATVIQSSVSDLDQALIRDGDTFFPLINRAMPAAILDEDTNELFFLRGSGGKLSVEQDLGSPLALRSAQELTEQNDTKTIITYTVPAGKSLRIKRLEGQCRAWGYFTIWVDSVRIARSNSGPNAENPIFLFDPYDVASEGQEVEVRYTQSFGPQVDLSAVLFTTED